MRRGKVKMKKTGLFGKIRYIFDRRQKISLLLLGVMIFKIGRAHV